jgi:hypothetical protein
MLQRSNESSAEPRVVHRPRTSGSQCDLTDVPRTGIHITTEANFVQVSLVKVSFVQVNLARFNFWAARPNSLTRYLP